MHVETARQTLQHWLSETLVHARFQLGFRITAHAPGSLPLLSVTFDGPDQSALLHRHGELLLALEHLATQVLHLDPQQHDLISFDSANFKSGRSRALERSAEAAVREVRTTGRPFHFSPMSSRERRLLHLVLTPSGLHTASEGEPPRRHLVLHPSAPNRSPVGSPVSSQEG